jgi:hypothetical protein
MKMSRNYIFRDSLLLTDKSFNGLYKNLGYKYIIPKK